MKQLERFHQRALRSILGIRWQDRVTNTEVFKRTNCISMEAMLLKSCPHWTGHVVRMEDHRIPKQLLFGELERDRRGQGRPCKPFKGTVKAGLQWCGIPPTELVATALDRQRRDFMKYTFNIVMCQDICEPTCFKLGMMLNTTKLYSIISV